MSCLLVPVLELFISHASIRDSLRDQTTMGAATGLKINGDYGPRHSNPRLGVEPELEEPPHQYSPEIQRALESVQFIARHIKQEDDTNEIVQDWKYMAMVLDRLFLWIFTLACVLGAVVIIFQAPSLYDTRESIDTQFSSIKVLSSDPDYNW